ncbi:MAG: DUF3179 domain-containing protein [Pseudomonadota bacterium]
MTSHPLLTRRSFASALAAASLAGPVAARAGLNAAFEDLLGEDDAAYDAAIARLRGHGGVSLIPGLILAARFARWRDQPIFSLLAEISGDAGPRSWLDWMEWQEARPDIPSHDGYDDLKRSVFYRFDPRFEAFIGPERLADARIRFEEVTWGGVATDGIPALNPPPMTPAREADYLVGSDTVIGVSVNGDVRAYPLRILAWHEMLNDVIGGVPVALPFCTLCSSGVLYETDIGRAEPLVFGTSGLLFRSNKLMWDHETRSLWNQFTGEPVIGPLATSGLRLKALPVVVEPWLRWSRRHPDSLVMAIDTGFERNYGSGYFYDRYIRSPDLIFPARADESRLAKKDYVFGVRTLGAAKAWPLAAFEGGRVLNDSVGALNVVLIGDRLGQTVRAYDRGARKFEEGPDPDRLGVDGQTWRVGEDALTGPSGEAAPRIAGHVSYWFAWNNYEGPRAEVFSE